MTLTSASRASTIHHLEVWFMLRTPQEYIFTFHELHKSWRKGATSPNLVLHKQAADKVLRVVEAIDAYLNRTKTWRDESKSQLLSFRNYTKR